MRGFQTTAICAALAAALALASGVPAQAQTYSVLYRFKGGSGDGAQAAGPLIADGAGNLYGATVAGGELNIGTVFKLVPGKRDTVLHFFTGVLQDGALPYSGLVMDGTGTLYGTTNSWGFYDYGTVFKVMPDGTESLLHSFGNTTADGRYPGTKLLLDAQGNLYGTAPDGGNFDGPGCYPEGCGIVFKLAPDGTETILHTFAGGADGAAPDGEVIADGAGNLYGTTTRGGSESNGFGAIYKLAPDGTMTILHAFTAWDGQNGRRKSHVTSPDFGLVRDATGNLYGTTVLSSRRHNKDCPGGASCGSIFELTADGKLHILHYFTGEADGARPNSTLVMDAAGSLYGTTVAGGSAKCSDHIGCGTVFRYSPDGSMAILHRFNKREGTPRGIMLGADGALYGATYMPNDPHGTGSVFRIGL